MLHVLIALVFSAHAWLKFEDFESAALVGVNVLRVDCPAGRVLVERDESNFHEHFGTLSLPISPAACEILTARAGAALACYGHARIDLFLDYAPPDSKVVVDAGFVRREGPCR